MNKEIKMKAHNTIRFSVAEKTPQVKNFGFVIRLYLSNAK